MSDEDQPFSSIKSPQELLVVILPSFLMPIFGIILIVQLVVGPPRADPAEHTAEAVALRLQPVGRLEIGASSAPASATVTAPVDGKTVYDKTCVGCHAQSVAGSPKIGDKAAWAPRIKTGFNALVQSVLKGKNAMPPKGGNPALSDAEIRAAVEFLVSQGK